MGKGDWLTPRLHMQAGESGPACLCAEWLTVSRGIPSLQHLCSPLKELSRGQVFWCYQEGLIIRRESIPNDFNGIGSQTAVEACDKENLKYPVFIMLSVFNYVRL